MLDYCQDDDLIEAFLWVTLNTFFVPIQFIATKGDTYQNKILQSQGKCVP